MRREILLWWDGELPMVVVVGVKKEMGEWIPLADMRGWGRCGIGGGRVYGVPVGGGV